MRLLDLFCGAGGCSVGYHRAGFDEIVGVDHKPMPRYPFDFVQTDALGYLAGLIDSGRVAEFDLIHASPPCQAYSDLSYLQNTEYPDLIAATRELLKLSCLPYVIENVPGAPLIAPVQLCGSSFNLRIRRHRLFETSHFVLVPPCLHYWQDNDKKWKTYRHGKWIKTGIAHVYGSGGGKVNSQWSEAMGIDWMTRKELSQAIPPAYTEYIGREMLKLI